LQVVIKVYYFTDGVFFLIDGYFSINGTENCSNLRHTVNSSSASTGRESNLAARLLFLDGGKASAFNLNKLDATR